MYLTTSRDSVDLLSGERVGIVTDCHQGQVARTIACTAQIAALLLRTRPRCIVSTGALPGLLAAVLGRALGARVIWIDSVANAGELSACGRWARSIAHSHFTQWPQVAARENSEYLGSLF
jgi:UDP-N-acetylglucosamine:LPS N-acetylglucosamine transferase